MRYKTPDHFGRSPTGFLVTKSSCLKNCPQRLSKNVAGQKKGNPDRALLLDRADAKERSKVDKPAMNHQRQKTYARIQNS
jgi:hypothetical protein